LSSLACNYILNPVSKRVSFTEERREEITVRLGSFKIVSVDNARGRSGKWGVIWYSSVGQRGW
jgi:hypothetical protein